jgi:hypothetical protein
MVAVMESVVSLITETVPSIFATNTVPVAGSGGRRIWVRSREEHHCPFGINLNFNHPGRGAKLRP